MKRYYFPVNNGACCFFQGTVSTAIVNRSGNKKVNTAKTWNKIIPWNIFLLRGLEFFILGLCAQVSAFSQVEKLEKEEPDDGIFSKISQNLNIATKYVRFFTVAILAMIFGFFVLNVLPSRLSLLLVDPLLEVHLHGLVVGVFKIAIIYLLFVFLRFMPFMQELYRFNGACNQVANSHEKVTEIHKMSPHYALNFLNYLVFTLLLSTFVVSLAAIHVNSWLDPLINLGIIFGCMMLSYEILWALSVIKHKWMKDFILLTSWLTSMKPSLTQDETVRITFLDNTNLGKKDYDTVEEDKIAMAALLSEMQTKLIAADRYDKSDTEWIIATVLNLNRAEIKLQRAVTPKQYREIMRATERRSKGEPLSSIFGFVDFYGLRLDINRKVLSPRMETELLVSETLKLAKHFSQPEICDLCTGSGAIAIAVAKHSQAKVCAIDISKPALQTAEMNAKRHEVKIDFIQSNLFENLKRKVRFDIIVSNPPYIQSEEIDKLSVEVKKFDPRLALDGGEDGLDFYREICEQSKARLKPGGYLLFELGKGQAADVRKLMKDAGLIDTHVVKDYNGIERIIYGRSN